MPRDYDGHHDRDRDSRRRSRSNERSTAGGSRRNHSPVEQKGRRSSRSRSPLDRRQRSRSRERERDRERERPRRRSRSLERRERNLEIGTIKRSSKSPPLKSKSSGRKERKRAHAQKVDLESCQNVDDEMAKMMGFGGFDTTKNKKVKDNVQGTVKINKPRKYRQYMNRKGGFNRPLDYVA